MPTLSKAALDTNWRNLQAAVAAIIGAFSNVEFQAAILLAALLKTRAHHAVVILSTVSANKVRRDIINNIAGLVLAKEDDLVAVEKILSRISGAAKLRNKFAHGLQSIHPERPKWLCLMSAAPEQKMPLMHYELFSARQLKNFERQFDALARDISELVFPLRKAKRITLRGTRF
jgi:hypothetical protein